MSKSGVILKIAATLLVCGSTAFAGAPLGKRETYVSHSSRDGVTFTRGAVWEHELGAGAQIGLVAFGGSGFTARFDHVRLRALPSL